MVRVFQEDKANKYLEADTITSFNQLKSSHSSSLKSSHSSSPGFLTFKTEDYILYITIYVYDEDTGFHSVKEAIKIDRDLHVRLQSNSCPVPLPTWLVEGSIGKISRYSMLQNLPDYLRNVAMIILIQV